ncbi:MAG: TonB-dependent receptor plug domain-containing protein [Syntrophobacteraceae bacterium]
MKLNQKVVFYLLLMFAAFPGFDPVWAEQDSTGEYRLGEVLVSAPKATAEAIQTSQTVTAQDIRDRGARTLDEAIELLPGVHVRTGGDGVPRVDVRGFRTRDVVLLLNGTPFNSTFDGQFDPSSIPVENIAKIEMVTGGVSVLYGPGGNGGVINIITKQGQPGLHGSLGAEGAQGSSYLASGTLSGAVDKWNAFASGSVFSRQGFLLSDSYMPTPYQGSGWRNNSDLYRDNAFANVGYSPSDKTSFGVTYSVTDDSHGIPSFAGNPASPFANNVKYERIEGSQNNSVQAAMNHEFAGPFSIKAWGYYNQLDMLDNLYDNSSYTTQNQKGSSSTDSTTKIAGANVQMRGDFGKCGIATVGFMSEDDEWIADGFKVAQVKTGKKTTLVRQSFNVDDSFQLYSGLFQYEVSPLEHLGFVAGLGIHDQTREQVSNEDYSYLIGVYYDLFTGTRLKVNTSRKVRFPTLKDLYDTQTGNPNLVPEWSINYEAGIEQDLPAKTRLSVTGFAIDAHNFIEVNNVTNISENFDKYQFRGVEVSADNRYIQNLLLRASYSFLHSENDDPGIHTDELQYRPRDKVALDATYRFPCGTSVNATLLYVANQYDVSTDGLQALPMPSYTVVDMKINQTLMNNTVDLYIGVRNLFDQNYADNYGYPQAGRTIYGGVKYRF